MPEIPLSVMDKAAAIQGEFNDTITALRTNNDLTFDAKRRRMAQAYLNAQEQLGKLRGTWSGDSASKATVLSKDIFGLAARAGADAISARDAADRASQLDDPSEAARLLGWADDNGDDVLARAIAQHAYQQAKAMPFGGGWSEVLNQYTETRPDVAQKLADLEAASRNDAAAMIQAGFIFGLAKPTELERVHDMESLAAQA